MLPFSSLANSRLLENFPAQDLHSVLSIHGGDGWETWEKGSGPSGDLGLLQPWWGTYSGSHCTIERLQMGFGLLILSTNVWSYQCRHSGCLGRHCGVMDGTGDWDSRPGFSPVLRPGLSSCPQTGYFLALTLIFFMLSSVYDREGDFSSLHICLSPDCAN